MSTLTPSTVLGPFRFAGNRDDDPARYVENKPGLLRPTTAPAALLIGLSCWPAFHTHTLPSSNGATMSDTLSLSYLPKPLISRFAWCRSSGCCSQLIEMGACLAMYSSYQSIFSDLYDGSQSAIAGVVVAFALLELSSLLVLGSEVAESARALRWSSKTLAFSRVRLGAIN